ncbi:MAG: HPr family phosphocarrier protein [Candidatus Krumholzibacteria bacterium]|nr:HPr family phosphocarrier protein [Candidatus Krumholzibacteria bacterium]
MLEFTKRIDNKIGLHLRAAGEFVKVAAQFRSEVTVHNGDRSANGKSILGLAGLAAARGAFVRVVVEGPDEEAAQRALANLFEQNFHEE